MKFENTQVFNFEGALRGLRNPKESWGKSDSRWMHKCLSFGDGSDWCESKCHYDQCMHSDSEFYIGENDMKLVKLVQLQIQQAQCTSLQPLLNEDKCNADGRKTWWDVRLVRNLK